MGLAPLITFLDWFAVAVFAVTGALVASRKQMDIIGFAALGTVTGIGGGTVRDVLLGAHPIFWIHQPAYLMVSVAVSIVVFFAAHIPESRYRVLLWLDAVGLALVSATGAARGLDAGVGPIVATVMGIITAVSGGIIRDLLGGEETLLVKTDVYVTAALAGSLAFVASSGLGLDRAPALLAGAMCCFAVRGSALAFGWSWPPYRARPGRSYSSNRGCPRKDA